MMLLDERFANREPTRAEVDALPGPVLLEFGAEWCGYCQAAQPHVAAGLAKYPQVTHVRIEDGKGKPLGRSFRVKLWPTFIFLRDGQVVEQAVRPDPAEFHEKLAALGGPGSYRAIGATVPRRVLLC